MGVVRKGIVDMVKGEYMTSAKKRKQRIRRKKRKKQRNERRSRQGKSEWDIDECPPEIVGGGGGGASCRNTTLKPSRAYQALILQTWGCKQIVA